MRPHRRPHATPEAVVATLLALRAEKQTRRPNTLRQRLAELGLDVAAASTVTQVLSHARPKHASRRQTCGSAVNCGKPQEQRYILAMKVFISSLITGMEGYREAASKAIRSLGHEPITAEQFPAGASSPRIACLSGVRESGLVVLLMGANYGAVQNVSAISATHEEYREAKGVRPVHVFVQEGVTREPLQQAFLQEVQDWEHGHFRSAFSTPEQLREAVTRSIHEYQLSTAVAPVDSAGLLARALVLLSPEQRTTTRSAEPLLQVSVVGGPTQSILRPVEIERTALYESLLQRALLGEHRIFELSRGNSPGLDQSVLTISQDSGAHVLLDEQGALRVSVPIAPAGGHLSVLIHEHVTAAMESALGYAAETFESIDATHRLSRVVVAAAIRNVRSVAWRTRAEHNASPNSVSIGGGFGREEKLPVHLQPPDRARAALAFGRPALVEDLTTLLKRQWK